MNTKKRCYTITVKLNRFYRVHGATVHLRGDGLIAEKIVHAVRRDHAVYLALQWYWQNLTDKVGPVHMVLVVDDPYHEVIYTSDFSCAERKNNYLHEEVIERIIRESDGELTRNTSKGTAHHPPNDLARVKRRRKLPFWVAPSIYSDVNGTLFYRMTVRSQISRRGRLLRRRKVRFVRLEAKALSHAVIEIVAKGLFDLHMKHLGYFKDNGLQAFIKRHLFRKPTLVAA